MRVPGVPLSQGFQGVSLAAVRQFIAEIIFHIHPPVAVLTELRAVPAAAKGVFKGTAATVRIQTLRIPGVLAQDRVDRIAPLARWIHTRTLFTGASIKPATWA